VKTGIVVLAELSGRVADEIFEIQKRFDPRMAAELPPHVTVAGSSGMGPISSATSICTLEEALAPVAMNTTPFAVRFGAPMRFMQSPVVVLPIDPNGPIRALHERIKSSGLSYEQPRFTFTPHCTLSFYPEQSRDALRALSALRFNDPVMLDSIQVYRAIDVARSEKVLEFALSGARAAAPSRTAEGITESPSPR
jgi:2'-5' RNA ligase